MSRRKNDDLADMLNSSLAPVDAEAEAEAHPTPPPEPERRQYSGGTSNLSARVPDELKLEWEGLVLRLKGELKHKVTTQEAMRALVELLLDDEGVQEKLKERL